MAGDYVATVPDSNQFVAITGRGHVPPRLRGDIVGLRPGGARIFAGIYVSIITCNSNQHVAITGRGHATPEFILDVAGGWSSCGA